MGQQEPLACLRFADWSGVTGGRGAVICWDPNGGLAEAVDHRDLLPGPCTASLGDVDEETCSPTRGDPLSKGLARTYLTVVALVWFSHLVGLVLLVANRRWHLTTQNPWIVLPGFIAIASAVGVIWLVDRRLNRDRPRMAESLRMVGLAYGSAVPTARRRLRG